MKRMILTALLAGSLGLGTMPKDASARTDFRVNIGTGDVVDFRTTPRWVSVPTARGVYVVRDDMRPNQDVFRYGNKYYIYSNNTWYRSNRWNGRYVMVREGNLPRELWNVPRTNWRAYPTSWNDRRWDSRHRRWDDNGNRNGNHM
jgi:hypothetical protein